MLRKILIFGLCFVAAACDFLFGGSYRVTRLDKYVEYVAGRDLYLERGVGVLSFDCDGLRDQVVQVLHRSMLDDPNLKLQGKVRDEIERLGLFGARREAKTLHLINDVTVGAEGLEAWRGQVIDLV